MTHEFFPEPELTVGNFEKIFDSIESCIYVTDLHSDMVLFANQRMIEEFNLPEDYKGGICWKMFQNGFSGRCALCQKPALLLNPDKTLTGEEYNRFTGRYYRTKDFVIPLASGQLAHIHHSTDITEIKLAEITMPERLRQQELMSAVAQSFVASGTLSSTVQTAFKSCGEFMNADHVYAFRYDAKTDIFRCKYEWTDDSSISIRDTASDLKADIVWKKYLDSTQNSVFIIDAVNKDPNINYKELKPSGIKCVINMPVYINETLWGFVGAGSCETHRKWSVNDKHLISLLTGLISSALKRETIEKDLNTAEKTLRTVIDGISAGIYWKDTNSVYEGCNTSFAEHIGSPTTNIEGKSDFDFFPADHAKEHIENDRDVINNKGSLLHTEHTLKGRVISIKMTVINDEAGSPVRIVGVSEDITDKKSEQDKKEDALIKLRAVTENFNGAVWCADKDLVITVTGGISPLGINLKDAAGKRVSEIYKDFPEITERTKKAFIRGAQKFSTVTKGVTANCYIAPIFDSSGEVSGVVFTAVDISDQIELQRRLEEAIISAERASNSKGDFLTSISSDIKLPLTEISDMLKSGQKDGIDGKSSILSEIDIKTQEALEKISRLLDMSKMDTSKFELSFDEFDIKNVIERACSNVKEKTLEKSIDLSVQFIDDFPHLLIGDEDRISQVMSILLENAIKFSPDNSSVAVNVRRYEVIGDKSVLKIEVEDSGFGIPEDQQHKIFSSFEHADATTAKTNGGTGLSLAICKKLVNLMDGEIWVESKENRGSTFAFTVSLKHSKNNKDKLMLLSKIDRSNLKILAVDDSAETTEYFKHVMAGFSLDCDTAGSGSEAVEAVKRSINEGKPYNIIFLDWRMPDISGEKIAKEIKDLTKDRSVVVIVSVSDWDEIKVNAARAGISKFIQKPLLPSTLLNTINEIIGADSKTAMLKQLISCDLSAFTVLIAEDAEINREIILPFMEEAKVKTEFASNGREAFLKFSENPDKYDLIFMDLHMPEMDGFEATMRIRSLPCKKAGEVPIIAMTASVFDEDVKKCLNAGMNDHIPKPVDYKIVFSKLNSYLCGDKSVKIKETSESAEYIKFLPGIDVDTGIRRMLGNKKLYFKLLKNWGGDALLNQLLGFAAENNTDGLVFVLHTFKGISANLSLPQIHALSVKLENDIKDGLAIDDILPIFIDEMQKTGRMIDELLQREIS